MSSALDSRARRAAKRVGLRAEKSRWRRYPGSWDNRGGFRLSDPCAESTLVDGDRFTMSAEQVIAFCARRATA